jgi:D-threonate/D-erythronate kinase
MSAVDNRITVAIVADDLTGALDAAAPFAAEGFRTRVLVDVCDNWLPGPNVQVLSLALETRHAPPEAAQSQVSASTTYLRNLSTGILFKKIDSTLRGNVAEETVACLRASGCRHALIAPSVPVHGRTMRGGEVFIEGVGLARMAIASDALSPPPSMTLADAMRLAAPDVVVHTMAKGRMPSLEAGADLNAYILDSETEEDLDAIAQFGFDRRNQILFVGASGLSGSLARVVAAQRGDAAPKPGRDRKRAGSILFLVGSRAPRAAEQVAALCAEGVPSRTTTGLESLGFRSGQDVTLIVVPDPETTLVAAEVATELGEATARLVLRLAADTLVLV